MLLVGTGGASAVGAVHGVVPAVSIPGRLVVRGGLVVRVGDRRQLVVVVHGMCLVTLLGSPAVRLVDVGKGRVALLTLVRVLVAQAFSGCPRIGRGIRRIEVLRRASRRGSAEAASRAAAVRGGVRRVAVPGALVAVDVGVKRRESGGSLLLGNLLFVILLPGIKPALETILELHVQMVADQ